MSQLLILRPNRYYSTVERQWGLLIWSLQLVDGRLFNQHEVDSMVLNHYHIPFVRPRPLPCPGTHLANVCLLRTPNEANYIAKTAEQRHVVIVGTSFIGMEAAAYLVDKAASVSVIGRSSAPFSHVFGKTVFLSLGIACSFVPKILCVA